MNISQYPKPLIFALLSGLVFWLVWFGLFNGFNTQTEIPNNTNLLLVVIIYPILEELVFRGLIQEIFEHWLKLKTQYFLILANIITSSLFALLHIVWLDNIWLGLVFLPSLIFGYLKQSYRSIYPSIGVHIYYNAGYLFCVWLLFG